MKQNHLFFDLDGTVFKTDLGITKSVQKSLEQFGIYPKLEELLSFVGPPLHESYKKQYGLEGEQYEQALRAFHTYYRATGIFEAEEFSGMRKMLESLVVAGKKLYFATSKPEIEARRVVEHFGYGDLFTYVGGSDGDYNTKRATKASVIEYVIDTCGLKNKSDIVMVGDKNHDVIGARTVGIDVVGVLFGFGDRQELSDADYIVETVEELGALLLK